MSKGRNGVAGRKYPPLLIAVTMMLALLAIMPSALNLPQSTPSETLEYAPVPPDDQTQPPPAVGNFSRLGLGSSSAISAGVAPDADLPDGGGIEGRAVKARSTKRCVGNPPRQTEDPLAPPCVGFFEGDNGGSTYQGVTRDEIRVVIQVDGFSSNGNYKGTGEDWPYGEYFDLAKPMEEDDHSVTRYLRAWQQYFNERYQTYGRYVHFWAYYPESWEPEGRRAQAADNYEKLKPFAVAWGASPGEMFAYNQVMASKGVLTFSGQAGLRAEIFRKFPKLAWGYYPSLEEHAKSFTAFVCEKVAPNPVGFSGNPGENGKPRKYGLIYSEETGEPLSKPFLDLVRPEIAKCGVEFVIERTHPYSYAQYDARTTGDYAAEAMASFQQAGVTTVMWMFGYETNFSKSAAALNYRPEWILAGDGWSEGLWGGQGQEPSVWDHAVTYTFSTRTAFGGVSQPCREAYLAVDPEIPRGTLDLAIACFFYDELRQLFTGIQVAGSRLNPNTLDKGFHAIPAVPSSDPSVPACYYRPGDYTCVKDGTILWFDAQYQDENSANTAGCWRLTDGGQRYIPGGWPDGNVNAGQKASDPCNGDLGGLQIAG